MPLKMAYSMDALWVERALLRTLAFFLRRLNARGSARSTYATFNGTRSPMVWRQELPGYVPSAYNLILWLPAAFTRLLPNSGPPLYGWLAKSADLRAARFSGLQGPNSTPIRFIWNHLPPWLKREEKPVRNGLEFYHCCQYNQS